MSQDNILDSKPAYVRRLMIKQLIVLTLACLAGEYAMRAYDLYFDGNSLWMVYGSLAAIMVVGGWLVFRGNTPRLFSSLQNGFHVRGK